MVRSLTLLAGGLLSLSAVSLQAEDAVLRQLFGRGVHAFNSRDLVEAHKYFTSAIDSGTKDPRSYYFRGLVCRELGRKADAELDFQKGSELEILDVDKRFDVARSLIRVQGQARVALETYRLEARKAARMGPGE